MPTGFKVCMPMSLHVSTYPYHQLHSCWKHSLCLLTLWCFFLTHLFNIPVGSHQYPMVTTIYVTLLINLSLLFITFDSMLLDITLAIHSSIYSWHSGNHNLFTSLVHLSFHYLIFKSCPWVHARFFVYLRALGFLTLHQPTASLFFINQPLPYSSPTKLHLFLIMVQSASSKSKAPCVKTGPLTKKPHNKKSVRNGKCSCSWVLMNLILNVYRWECRSCLWETCKCQSEWVCLFK